MKYDLAKVRPPRELLERLVDEERLADFVNTRSPASKVRTLDVNAMTKALAIDLMMEEPNLIRRPLLLSGGRAVFGYKPDEYDELTRS